jgi:acetoin utilization protein AcuC
MGGPTLTVVWDPRFLEYDFGPHHPFSERPRGLAVDLLREVAAGSDALAWIDEVEAADRGTLETFHRSEYIDRVEEAGAAAVGGYLDAGDTPAFPDCHVAAARIVGGALRALGATEERRRPAFHPAGGLHHARPDGASGFCIYNDLAVAIDRLVRDGRRVAYVDLDAHHGDGVMYGFYDSGRVLDIDFHQDGRTLFPGTGFPEETGRGDGAGLKVNLPLPPFSGDRALLPLFDRVALPLLRDFRPDALVLQHGVDGHVGDPLAQLQYTPRAYAEIDGALARFATERPGLRWLVTGGGGYRPASVARVLATTGRIVAGEAALPPATPLPPTWGAQFRSVTGRDPPKDWTDDAPEIASDWGARDEARLLRALEHHLGRRFPPNPG